MRTALLLVATLVLAFGCKKDEGAAEPSKSAGEVPAAKEPAAAAEPPAKAPDRYQVRGEVKGYDEASNQLAIHHESIPDFKNAQGKKSGMMSMQMSFRVADGVDGKSLAVGDKIKFEFTVEWEAKPPIVVTKVEKLPADTQLEL